MIKTITFESFKWTETPKNIYIYIYIIYCFSVWRRKYQLARYVLI